MVEDTGQVHLAGAVPGGAHRLAGHREHPPYPAVAPWRLVSGGVDGVEAGPDPGSDRGLQRRPVHTYQHPPDRHRAWDPPGDPETGVGIRGEVGGPFPDRRERAGAAEHGAHRDRQERGEPVTHSAASTWVRYLRESFQQRSLVTFGDQTRLADPVRDLRGQLVGHGGEGR